MHVSTYHFEIYTSLVIQVTASVFSTNCSSNWANLNSTAKSAQTRGSFAAARNATVVAVAPWSYPAMTTSSCEIQQASIPNLECFRNF